MSIPTRQLRLAFTLLASALALGILPPASAQQMHEHAHSGSAVAQIQLDDGRKWATDGSLRSGMTAIRKAFDADHPAIHAGKETNGQYDALASQVETQVKDIVKNCKLPAAADANLHFVIADLLQGVSLMRGTDPGRSRHDGAALVHGALIAYGKYFEDPGWVK
jgi:hypothetical protein